VLQGFKEEVGLGYSISSFFRDNHEAQVAVRRMTEIGAARGAMEGKSYGARSLDKEADIYAFLIERFGRREIPRSVGSESGFSSRAFVDRYFPKRSNPAILPIPDLPSIEDELSSLVLGNVSYNDYVSRPMNVSAARRPTLSSRQEFKLSELLRRYSLESVVQAIRTLEGEGKLDSDSIRRCIPSI
jgi:hypothetical protein